MSLSIKTINLIQTMRAHPNLTMLFGLFCVTAIGYWPALTAYFISDDYLQLSYLLFNAQKVLSGNQLREWFLGFIDAYVFFRPVAYTYMLVDFVTWGLQPWGYHLTRIGIHWLASFQVYLIAWQLLRHRLKAGVVSLLFAILPVHVGAVSWIAATTDIVCGFFAFSSFLFFVLYRNKRILQHYILCLFFFVIALSAKEVGLVLPAAFLVYDLVLKQREVFPLGELLRRYLPMGLILAIYFGIRLGVLGTFGYGGTQLSLTHIENWFNGTFRMMGYPYAADLTEPVRLFIIGLMALFLIFLRPRRIVVFGLLWIFVTFLPTIYSVSGASGRSFYVPSFGLVLVLGMFLVEWATLRPRIWRFLGIGGLAVVILLYSQGLWASNQSMQIAGQIALAIQEQVKTLHPSMPSDARLVFTGVPDETPAGTLVYLSGLGHSFRILYRNPSLEVHKFAKYPIWLDDLNRTFFFQVDHRRVYERTDLITALEQRKACSSFSQPAIVWNFATDTQGWEALNDVNKFSVRDGALAAQSVGNDPVIGSPLFDIPAMAIGEIEITMRVRARQPNLRGEIYWLATDQLDFYPGLNKSFMVQANGEFHTYSVNLAQTGALLMGDHITQLRLDPVDAPAEIEIKSIEIFSHCSTLENNRCACP